MIQLFYSIYNCAEQPSSFHPSFPRATLATSSMSCCYCAEIGLANLATNLDYHSVGYRGHISCDIEKLEQFHFHLTGPNIVLTDLKKINEVISLPVKYGHVYDEIFIFGF